MRAQLPAAIRDTSDLEVLLERAAAKAVQGFVAQLREQARSEIHDPDEMIGWAPVAKIDAELRGPGAKPKVRQTIWKLVARGVLSRPIRINARVSRFRRGTVIAELTKYYTRNSDE